MKQSEVISKEEIDQLSLDELYAEVVENGRYVDMQGRHHLRIKFGLSAYSLA